MQLAPIPQGLEVVSGFSGYLYFWSSSADADYPWSIDFTGPLYAEYNLFTGPSGWDLAVLGNLYMQAFQDYRVQQHYWVGESYCDDERNLQSGSAISLDAISVMDYSDDFQRPGFLLQPVDLHRIGWRDARVFCDSQLDLLKND